MNACAGMRMRKKGSDDRWQKAMSKKPESLQVESAEDLIKCGDGVGVGLSILVGCPAFSLEPQHLASKRFGREDVFLEAVANHENLLGWQLKHVDPKLEDNGVGLAHTHNSTLDNTLEIASQVEVAQHAVDIAIEVAHKHHGIVLAQEFEHWPCFLDA